MGFKKGNQLWKLRKSHGRKSKQHEERAQEIVDEEINADELRALLRVLVAFGKAGNIAAIREALDRKLGKSKEYKEIKQQISAEMTHDIADDAIADVLGILAGLGALQPGVEEGGDAEAE